MTAHRLRSYLLLLIVAVIWGIAGPVIKFTLRGIPPLPFLAYRFVLSAVVSIIYFSFSRNKLPKAKNIPLIIVYGLTAFTIALGTLFIGLDKTTVLDQSLISLIGPLMVVVGGVVFFRDRITKREKLGIVIVLIGTILTVLYPVFMGKNNLKLSGNLFILAFLVSDSSASLIAKKLVREKVAPLTLVNIGFIVGAVTLVPISGYFYGFSETFGFVTSLPLKYHLGVWYMAILSGTLAYFLQVLAQKSIEISEAAIFRYLSPIFAVPLAVLWLGEEITVYFVFGAVLISSGVILAEYKRKKN